MYSLNFSNLHYPQLQRQSIQTGQYSMQSFYSIGQESSLLFPQNNDYDIQLSQKNHSYLSFPEAQVIIPLTGKKYVQPVGSRLPLEKDHHPFSIMNNNNNDKNDNNNKFKSNNIQAEKN